MITGLALSRQFFAEAVAPIVERHAPGLRYTAGRLGPRSDALGFDDAISRDHGWGPCCTLLLDPGAFDATAPRLDAALRQELPTTFGGYSTSYRDSNLVTIDAPPVDHDVELTTPERLLRHSLGATLPLAVLDWLAIDAQAFVEVTAGELFRDDLGFAATRDALAFYPDDLRLHMIAVEWTRIAEEQAFPGRAGSRGDEAGSAIVAARLVESAMRLGFYVERRYPPYSKWFGSAFKRLGCAALYEPMARTLAAATWEERDRAWTAALRDLVALHERAGLLAAGAYRPASVYAGRPGIGIPAFGAGSITQLVDELRAQITDPAVRALPPRLGSIDQVVTWRDLEESRARWRAWYRAFASRD